jgi:2-oxo-3-hexenedioate decarboxylase
MSTAAATELAHILDDAQRTATAVEQPSAKAALDLVEAYRAQHALLARRSARGDLGVGLKLGFTSRAKARQMGVEDVILGTITEGMQIEDGGRFDAGAFIHPRIEPELAFRLGGDLDRGGPVEIAAVAPALEIIDSRYRDFRFDVGDVVADNTSAAAFVVGPWTPFAHVGRIDNLAVELAIDGRLVETGSTAAILGDPLRAIDAAVRLAQRFDFPMRAGDILLAGAATVAVPLPRAGCVEATVSSLGRVSVYGEEGSRR